MTYNSCAYCKYFTHNPLEHTFYCWKLDGYLMFVDESLIRKIIHSACPLGEKNDNNL